MNRRTYLRASGLALVAGAAGCLGRESDGGPSEDGPATATGTPAETATSAETATPTETPVEAETPEEYEAPNEFGYATERTDGVDVPLVPLEDAYEWYRDDAAVFADARSRTAYRESRIAGAVHSPAPDGQAQDDPIAALSTAARIVTYCGCPHHLSTMRAASAIDDGYVHTYAIDEGFYAWAEAGYPLEGNDVEASPDLYTVSGRTDAAHAGAFAWLRHDPTGQREAAPIGEDGRFTLHVRFHGVDPETPVRLSTPAGELTEPLGRLADGPVEV